MSTNAGKIRATENRGGGLYCSNRAVKLSRPARQRENRKIGVGLVFFRPGVRAAEIGQTVEMSRDYPRVNNAADSRLRVLW